MRRSQQVWDADALLTDSQKRTLAIGTASCVDALDAIVISWQSGRHLETPHKCAHPSSDGGCGYDFVSPYSLTSARARLPSYDIIGRLEIAANLPKASGKSKKKNAAPKNDQASTSSAAPEKLLGCHKIAVECASRELKRQRSLLPQYFRSRSDMERAKRVEVADDAHSTVMVSASPSHAGAAVSSDEQVVPVDRVTPANEAPPTRAERTELDDDADEAFTDFSSLRSVSPFPAAS